MGLRHVIYHGSFHGFFSERCLPEGIKDRQGSCVICHDRSHLAPHYRVTACAGAFIKKNKQKVETEERGMRMRIHLQQLFIISDFIFVLDSVSSSDVEGE